MRVYIEAKIKASNILRNLISSRGGDYDYFIAISANNGPIRMSSRRKTGDSVQLFKVDGNGIDPQSRSQSRTYTLDLEKGPPPIRQRIADLLDPGRRAEKAIEYSIIRWMGKRNRVKTTSEAIRDIQEAIQMEENSIKSNSLPIEVLLYGSYGQDGKFVSPDNEDRNKGRTVYSDLDVAFSTSIRDPLKRKAIIDSVIKRLSNIGYLIVLKSKTFSPQRPNVVNRYMGWRKVRDKHVWIISAKTIRRIDLGEETIDEMMFKNGNLIKIVDRAQLAELENNQATRGGIDFTNNKIPLKVQSADEGIKFRIDPALLAQFQHAPGFVPVIINIQPMRDLRGFLAGASLK